MQGTKKVNEIINRGVTAVAMTVAIATVYGGLATEGKVTQGDVLPHHIQTALKLPGASSSQTTHLPENLPSLAMGNSDSAYRHR